MTRNIRIAKGSTTAPARRPPFATVEEAIAAFRAGKMIIVVDDEDRENEGDLTMAAELVTLPTHGLTTRPERLRLLALLEPVARRATGG